MTITAPTTARRNLEYLDPTTLVIGGNIRSDTQLGAEFVASVKERGVLEPVDAYRDDAGQIVLVRGQRRTLAAVKVGLTSIPVLVDDQAPNDADRLVDQWTENEHRAALTTRERIQAVEQMTLVGLTAGQIAKRASISKAQVAAAVAASKSQAAIDNADSLTLEDAAVLAEFEDDSDAIDQLLDAAQRGGMAARAQRIRDDYAEAQLVRDRAAELAAEGFTVIEAPTYENGTIRQLDVLRDGKKRIDPAEHATSCPGHVVWVLREKEWTGDGFKTTTKVHSGCAGWSDHGHTYIYAYGSTSKAATADLTPAEQETSRKERRHVIESNKDWKACTTVRRRWLADFAQRKAAPDGAEQLIAYALLHHILRDLRTGALELLGTSGDRLGSELTRATAKRATHITLCVAISAWEDTHTDDAWRNTYRHDIDVSMLTGISQWGYELSAIEQAIVDGTAAVPA